MPKNEIFHISKNMCYNVKKIGCDFMAKEPTKDGMHIEYHSVKKKDKASNCVHLTEDRICHCKPCYCYLGYCYDSTHCPYKEKEGQVSNNKIMKSKTIKEIGCSIPISTKVYTRFNKIGVVHHYDYKKRTLYVAFGDKISAFLYPESFQNGAVKLEESAQKLMARDIAVAIWK